MVGMPGPLVINNNQIYNNQAKDGAGVALEDVQNVTMNGNRISGNTSGSFTSGVYIRGGSSPTTSMVSLLNNFIYKNDDIGVNAQNVGTMTLTNNTIVNNGVGISAYPAIGGQSIRLTNNIVSQHSGCALTNGPYSFTVNSNLFFNGYDFSILQGHIKFLTVKREKCRLHDSVVSSLARVGVGI